MSLLAVEGLSRLFGGVRAVDGLSFALAEGRVHAIIEPNISRDVDPEQIRRQPGYLDAVENIWQSLKQYLD